VAKRQGDRYDSKTITAICDRGLKKAPQSDAYYKVGPFAGSIHRFNASCQILKRLRQGIVNKTEATHRSDPLTVLPAELFEMVLSYLEFKEIVLVDVEYLVLRSLTARKDMYWVIKGLESLLDIRPALLEKVRLLRMHVSKTDANSRQLCQELRQVVSVPA
jgi:hypothetical protein